MDFGKEFTSDKVSNLMGVVSASHLGWKLNVSSWRHINIAWRRKLCGGSIVNEDDPASTINALQSGHSLTTENRIYGLSPEAMLGASEDVMHLFLQASTDWQKVVRVVPGGVSLPYTQARREHFDALVAKQVIVLNKVSSSAPVGLGLNEEFIRLQQEANQNLMNQQHQTLTLIQSMFQEIKDLRAELAEVKQRMSLSLNTD